MPAFSVKSHRVRLSTPTSASWTLSVSPSARLDYGAILGASPADQGCTLANVHGALAAGPSVKERVNGLALAMTTDLYSHVMPTALVLMGAGLADGCSAVAAAEIANSVRFAVGAVTIDQPAIRGTGQTCSLQKRRRNAASRAPQTVNKAGPGYWTATRSRRIAAGTWPWQRAGRLDHSQLQHRGQVISHRQMLRELPVLNTEPVTLSSNELPPRRRHHAPDRTEVGASRRHS